MLYRFRSLGLSLSMAALLVTAAVSCSARAPESSEAAATGEAAGTTPVSTTAPETTDPVASGPVATALLGVAEYAEQLDNAAIELAYHLRITEDGERKNVNSRYRVLLGPGHDFAVGPLGETYAPRAHASGGKMVILSPEPGADAQKYVVRHGVAAFTTTRASQFIGHGLGGLTLGFLATPTTEQLVQIMKNAVDLGPDDLTIGDAVVACEHGRFTTQGITMEYWIEPGDAEAGSGPRLRRIVPDLSDQGDDDKAPELTIDLAWDTESPLPEGAFFTEGAPHVMLGEELPAVTLPLLSGETQRLSDLIGKKVIVLDFWATWCPVCLLGMPTLESVAEEYADRGVVAIAVNVGEDPAELESFVESQGWTLPVALDQKMDINNQLQVGTGLPSSMIVGLDGRVQVFGQGIPKDQDMYRKQLTEELEKVLSGEDLATERIERWQAMQKVFAEAG